MYSVDEIVGESGKSYGIGVILDSELLSNLTERERIEMVKEYVKELGGQTFIAYDNDGQPVQIAVAESNKSYRNKNGKRVRVNEDLIRKYNKNPIKQEASALADELISTAEYSRSEFPKYPHGWVDNNGKNKWDYWKTYIEDKEKTVWEATLNVATTANGEKILYDISPIKMVEEPAKSGKPTTKQKLSQTESVVNRYSAEEDAEYLELTMDPEQQRTAASAYFS